MSEDNVPEYDVMELREEESATKFPDIRASGYCMICGRYTDVPVIDSVPQCKCHRL